MCCVSSGPSVRDVLCVLWSQCEGCVVCPLIPEESKVCVCVCVCVCCMCVLVCVCTCVHVWECVCACVCVCGGTVCLNTNVGFNALYKCNVHVRCNGCHV